MNFKLISSNFRTSLRCVAKKVYHPTSNYNFNSSCPIRVIFGTVINLLLSKYAVERLFYFPLPLFSVRVLPWETLRP